VLKVKIIYFSYVKKYLIIILIKHIFFKIIIKKYLLKIYLKKIYNGKSTEHTKKGKKDIHARCHLWQGDNNGQLL